MKLDKKKATTFILCVALTTSLVGCANYKIADTNENSTTEVTQEVNNQTNNQEIKEENTIEEYINYLKEEIKEVEQYASDKWNSEEYIQKRENIKQKLVNLIDFVFNGKEINGITFSELKTEEKEKIINELTKLDVKIDEYIPDYKERFKNWFNEKSTNAKEWFIDRSADALEIWDDYKGKVTEKYQKRKL